MNGFLNKVMLIGYLGDDVKIHYFDDKNCIARFNVATDESYRSKKNDQIVTVTQWHTIVVRNELAEKCEKYLSKGSQVYAEGKLKSREWQTEEGITKKVYEVHAHEITFLHLKKEIKSEQSSGSDSDSDTPNHGLPF